MSVTRKGKSTEIWHDVKTQVLVKIVYIKIYLIGKLQNNLLVTLVVFGKFNLT